MRYLVSKANLLLIAKCHNKNKTTTTTTRTTTFKLIERDARVENLHKLNLLWFGSDRTMAKVPLLAQNIVNMSLYD